MPIVIPNTPVGIVWDCIHELNANFLPAILKIARMVEHFDAASTISEKLWLIRAHAQTHRIL